MNFRTSFVTYTEHKRSVRNDNTTGIFSLELQVTLSPQYYRSAVIKPFGYLTLIICIVNKDIEFHSEDAVNIILRLNSQKEDLIMKKFLRKGEKGFTLIELLIVIVILGVLAAAIIPNLSKFIGRGTVGAANAELASVRTALAAYMSDNDGAAPADGDVAADNAALGEYITEAVELKEITPGMLMD